ncbi:MAG: hypothetical protein JWN86_891 [Planctomycetota bacterium]|nr:hypothetical protein [Planctomycetota bacterium]
MRRLGTVLLLGVGAVLAVALVVEQRRSASLLADRDEARTRASIAERNAVVSDRVAAASRAAIAEPSGGPIVGALLWVARMRRLSVVYQDRAVMNGMAIYPFSYDDTPAENQRKSRAVSLHHQRLRLKYERAALAPWLPVEPDPPAPFISNAPSGRL